MVVVLIVAIYFAGFLVGAGVTLRMAYLHSFRKGRTNISRDAWEASWMAGLAWPLWLLYCLGLGFARVLAWIVKPKVVRQAIRDESVKRREQEAFAPLDTDPEV